MVDIEALLIEWLSKRTEVEWFAFPPKDAPSRFGTVERTGGGMSSVVVDSPIIAIQTWAASRSEAEDLAYEVREILPRIAYESRVRKVSIESLYNFPDEKGDKARYQIVVHFRTV